MNIFLWVLTYVSLFFVFSILIAKILRYSRTPVHLRWELYPIAHEPERGKYGGSYYEEPDFWDKEIHKSHIAEIWEMFVEIAFLKGIFVYNRRLWYFSFPFHFGLYLLIATVLCIIIGGILVITGSEGGFATLVYYSTIIVGYAGIGLTIIGCIGLLIKRLTDENLKPYNSFVDYFNLVFILLVAASFLFGGEGNFDFSLSREFTAGLFTFNDQYIPNLPIGYAVHVILFALFLIYLPLTRMTHFVAKYFTYHNVRWDDKLNYNDDKLQQRIKTALNYGVSWSAPHMKTGKTWAEVATNLPTEEKK